MNYNHGIDLGYGNFKGVNSERKVVGRSVIGNFVPVKSGELQGDNNRLVLEYDGTKYLYGENAIRFSSTTYATMTEDRAYSREGLMLLMAALVELTEGLPVEYPNLMLGLPVLWCKAHKQNYIDAVAKMHSIDIYDLFGEFKRKKYFNISDKRHVGVISQPIANVYNLLLNFDGAWDDKKIHLRGKKIGIINIGYNTTEIAVLDALQEVPHRITSFPASGMFTIYDSLAQIIREEYGVTVTMDKIEKYYQDEAISVRGKIHSLGLHKETAKRMAADNLFAKIITAWRETWDLEYILLTGGTSIHLAEHLVERLGEQTVKDDSPVMSVANGLYKYAQRVWK